jgi:hypothetical protein
MRAPKLLHAVNAQCTFLQRLCMRTSPQRQRLLAQAAIALLIATVALRCLPFARIARWLGVSCLETAADSKPHRDLLASDIGWAVRAVARRLPWSAQCLTQAIAATLLNRLHGVSSTLYLGVTFTPSRVLRAHAWVRSGRRIVVGGARHQRFSVVGCFAGRFDE